MSYLHKLIPQNLRQDKTQHQSQFKIKPDALRTLDMICEGIVANIPWVFMRYDATYRIYTDASLKGFGYASSPLGSQHQILRSKKIPQHWLTAAGEANLDKTPMHCLELKAIELALENCPNSCNLLLYTDSQVAHNCIKKGVLRASEEFKEAQESLDKIQSLIATKNISLVIRWVRSEDNPADKPSREPHPALEYKDMCFEKINNEEVKFSEIRNQQSVYVGNFETTELREIVNGLANKTHCMKTLTDNIQIILDNEEFFMDDNVSTFLAIALISIVLSAAELDSRLRPIAIKLLSKGKLPATFRFDHLRDVHSIRRVSEELVNGVYQEESDMPNLWDFNSWELKETSPVTNQRVRNRMHRDKTGDYTRKVKEAEDDAYSRWYERHDLDHGNHDDKKQANSQNQNYSAGNTNFYVYPPGESKKDQAPPANNYNYTYHTAENPPQAQPVQYLPIPATAPPPPPSQPVVVNNNFYKGNDDDDDDKGGWTRTRPRRRNRKDSYEKQATSADEENYQEEEQQDPPDDPPQNQYSRATR